ncbi:hypothetical protein C8J57DRAFT_1254618 [Mycena rebaudengoi]|nr:hypothetical protein C8J57DRAFT_1254618 [Mycena rebaudengoi]
MGKRLDSVIRRFRQSFIDHLFDIGDSAEVHWNPPDLQMAKKEQQFQWSTVENEVMQSGSIGTSSGWWWKLYSSSLPSITRLVLLTPKADLLHSLLLADAIIGNNNRRIVQACPRLHSIHISRLDPSSICGFLKKRGEALTIMKKVRFQDNVELEERHSTDLKWLKSKGITVEIGMLAWFSDLSKESKRDKAMANRFNPTPFIRPKIRTATAQ